MFYKMPSSGMLRRMDLVRTEVSEERIAPSSGRQESVRWEQSKQYLATEAFCSSLILVTLLMEMIPSSETSVLTRATVFLSTSQFIT
jgi:hypothetical protein